MKRWGVHVCTGWNECSCWRINIRTPRWFIIIALTPGSKVQLRPYDRGRWGWVSIHVRTPGRFIHKRKGRP